MYFALYCILFGILVFSPQTEGSSLTWRKPMPFQVVSSTNRVEHQNRTRLIEGTINASLIWHFKLSSELAFVSLTLELNGAPIASGDVVLREFRAKYAVSLVQSSEIIVTLVIFEVTAALNGTFSCVVFARDQVQLNWKSNVQVDVVAPPSNFVTSSNQTIKAPAELTLNCSAVGKPDPSITWRRVSDGTVVTMPLNITGGKDGGGYRCIADNGVGKPLTKDVFVDVQFPPMVKVPSDVYVRREQTVLVICEVKGNPTPVITWSPCSEENVDCNDRYLNISKVQTARANYTCTATNALRADAATTVVLIGGKDIYLRLSVGEECDNKDSVWETLQKELVNVFSNTSSYSGADLINVRCGSLIFDVRLKFRTEVAEDYTISIIQNAIVNGKLGDLSVNVSLIIGIPPPTTTAATPTSTTPKPHDNTGLIIGAVLGGVAFVALIVFIIWCVRKKKCCSDRKEVSDNTDAAQGRKGKGQNGGDEAAYASTSMLPHSKRPVEKTNQGTVQALPMYAQVDKTKKTSNKGGAAQRQRQPGELQYAEVEHVTSGRSLPRKSSSEPIKPSNEEIVYADLV